MFFSNNTSNSKNLFHVLKRSQKSLKKSLGILSESDCKDKRSYLNFQIFQRKIREPHFKNLPAKPCCFRLAGANVGTFSDSPNFRELFLRFSCIFSALTLHAPAHDPKKRNDYQPKSTEPLHTVQNLPPDSKQGPLFTENSENAFLSRPENGLDRRAESTKSDEKISGIAPFYMKDRSTLFGNRNKKPTREPRIGQSAKDRAPPEIRSDRAGPRRRVLFRIGKPEYHEEVADEEAPDTEAIKRHGTDRFSDPYRENNPPRDQ